MIKENIVKIKERISEACLRINKNLEEITIIAVSKDRTIEEIKEVIEAGIIDIGENRVQEALLKYNQLSAISYQPSAIRWHMVGHLQTNKVKDALFFFNLIHSVDSLHLALEINKQAAKINKVCDILIEVNTSGEATKYGIKPEDTIEIVRQISQFKNLNIKGLMTIAPIVDVSEKLRFYFRMLRELQDKINSLCFLSSPLCTLSMGMSDDFEIAIEEGATMVRIGRAIFNT